MKNPFVQSQQEAIRFTQYVERGRRVTTPITYHEAIERGLLVPLRVKSSRSDTIKLCVLWLCTLAAFACAGALFAWAF